MSKKQRHGGSPDRGTRGDTHKAGPRNAARPEREKRAPAPGRTAAPHHGGVPSRAPRESEHKAAPRDTPRPEREKRGPAASRAATGEVWIYGQHPVTAALRNPARKILRIVGTAEALMRLREDTDADIDVPMLAHTGASSRTELDALLGTNAVHQGIAILVRTLECDLADVLASCADQKSVCLMVLDQVTDPHNVGAILRSAAAFGAAAVIAPEHGAPAETGAMAKSASGALDVTPYIKGGNLVRVLEALKEAGFWLVGLEADTPQVLSGVDLTGRIALVMGAEGEGLRRLVRETCDHLAKLPMRGAIESLNVSNAAAVALYEWSRQVTR